MEDISLSVNKVDSKEKIDGSAVYVNDIYLDDMLYAKTVRSTVSKGIIESITIPELPEGYYIVDKNDIPSENYVKIIFDDMPVFARDVVNYYGEPIMLLIGEDKEIINKIIEEIHIEYELLSPIYDYTDSVIHYEFEKGNAKEIFKKAKNIISHEYSTGYQEHIYLETQGIIGTIEDEKVTIIGSLQCPYYVKNAVMQILDKDEQGVRVIQATTGGGFGGKEDYPSLMACQVAIAVTKIGRPIKLIYDRWEDIEFTTKRHPSKIKLEAAIGKDKSIKAIRANVSLDGGAYIGLSGVVLQRAMIASSGAYTFPNLYVSGDVYQTNTVPNGAFRGFGAPQMIFAIEMFIHHIAKELNIDPLELRLRYLAKEGDKTSTNGTFRDPIIMNEMIDKAMELSDYKRKIREYSDSYRGIGMSWFLHGCGFTGSGEQKHIKAKVILKKDKDRVTILVASVDMGQGIKTTMKKIVSNILNIPLDKVILNNPDTDLVPDSGPTVASRTTMIVGGLVARAAKELKERWNKSEHLVIEKNYQQPSYIEWDEDKLLGDAYPAYSWGVNVVEVDVDKNTYEVDLKGIWSVYDIGKAIDERIVLGQADGGILQGIGLGMLERMTHKNGKIQQKTVTDYIIPTSCDVVNTETVIMDNPYPLGPYGAKGAGELTLIGGAPAVALAIENAINRKVTKIPVTPEYIMELMTYGKD